MKLLTAFLILYFALLANAAPWNHDLWMGNGDFWKSRCSITVVNHDNQNYEGRVITVKIGDAPNEAPLEGVDLRSLRVVNSQNRELLYNLYDADLQKVIRDTMIPKGALLTLPLVCDANASTTFTVYFNNASAWGMADFLTATPADLSFSQTAKLQVACSKVEHMNLNLIGEETSWTQAPKNIEQWNMRFPINIMPIADKTDGTPMLAVIESDSFKRGLNNPLFALNFQGQPVDLCQMGELLLFQINNCSQTIQRYYLYVADTDAKGDADALLAGSLEGSDIPSDQLAVFHDNTVDIAKWQELLHSDLNLIKNPDFENGDARPLAWALSGSSEKTEGVTLRKSRKALFGSYSAECIISPSAKPDWFGWRQSVSVMPTSTYLFGGWMQCENFAASGQLHAHINPQRGSNLKTVFLSAGRPVSGTSDWTPMFSTIKIPAGYDNFALHLTANCAGTMRHDGFLMAECAAVTIGEPQTKPQASELTLWQVNPLRKVFHETLPNTSNKPIEIHMAMNESEALQLAVRSNRDFEQLTVSLTPPVLRKKNSAVKRLLNTIFNTNKSAENAEESQLFTDITIGRVDFVPVDARSCYSDYRTPAWEFKSPHQKNGSDGWPGWWPDPIVECPQFNLRANQTQPLWINFNSNTNMLPGTYHGTIRITDSSKSLLKIPYQITLWDFALPLRPDFPAIYDIRFRNIDFTNWDNHAEAREKIMRFMAKKKLSPDSVMKRIPLKLAPDGTVTCDFTEYDKACQLYFDELQFKISYMPNNFYIFGWGHPPGKFLGEAPYEGDHPYHDVPRAQLRPQYKRVYQEALRLYWQHIKERGWSKYFVFYISDEPHFREPQIVEQMRVFCDMIHEVDPEIKIYSSTWRYCAEWDNSLDIWGVGHYGCFPEEEMRRQQQRGNTIWFTTDGQLCTDTPLLATERMLAHYAFKYKAQAYEFWGVSWYTYNPWNFGWHSYIQQSSTPGEQYFVRYPNGDGYLIYPPVPEMGLSKEPFTSIRVEAARDGVEDWCYLQKLQKLAEERNDESALKLIEDFLSFCEIPNAGGRYSGRNLHDAERLMELRILLGKKIEQLSR